MKEIEYVCFEFIANKILNNFIVPDSFDITNISKIQYKEVAIYGLENGKLDLKYHEDHVYVKVNVNSEIFDEAKEFERVNKLITKLSIITNTYISSERDVMVHYKYKQSNDLETNGYHGKAVRIRLFTSPSNEQVENFIQDNKYNVYYELYKQALISEDDVCRYMLFYNIIMNICDDNQHKTDNKIREICIKNEIDPQILPYRPKGKNYTESLFTRLRNEIAHNRNSNYIQTVEEIESNVYTLGYIVRQVITEYDK